MSDAIKIYHCDKCYQKLAAFGEGAVNTFIEICTLYLMSKNSVYYDFEEGYSKKSKSKSTIIKFLEIKGYIVTNDASEIDDVLIKIKPNGYAFDEEYQIHTFCPMGCREGD
jgi:hypothetical protein